MLNQYFYKALEIQPDFDKALLLKGNLCVGEKKYEEALNNYNKVLEKDPKDDTCLFNKAYVLYLMV